MRILAIRGSNLASLAEEFDLDLTSGALGAAGLFAITGPTGAGKSTLLDALCLALFDRTPRLGARSQVLIGRSDDVAMRLGAHDVRSLLRRGAASGWAEVDFEGEGGRRFRARWSVRRARGKATGKLQDQQITLENLDTGERLGGTRTETLDAIQARLGLSFDQFRRSALLAQGDFAAFLRADTRDRADLLERMTGTEIYGALSLAAHRRAGEVEAGLRARRELAGRIAVLDEAARAAAVAEHAGADAARAATRADVAAREAAVAWAERRSELAADAERAQAEVSAVAAAEEGAAGQRRLLARAQAAESVRAGWDERERARREQRRAEAARADALSERTSAARALEAVAMIADDVAAAAARSQAVRVRFGGPTVVEAVPAGRLDVAAIDARLAAAGGRVDAAAAWLEAFPHAARIGAGWDRVARLLAREGEAAAGQAEARRRDDALAAAQHAAERRREAALVEHGDAVARLEEAELVAQTAEEKRRAAPVDVARRRSEAAVKALGLVGKLAAVVERARADAAAGAAASARAAAAEVRTTEADAEARTAAAKVAAVAIRLDEAQAGLDRVRAAAGMAHARAELVPGEPCPVCGAVEHPWAGGGVIDALIREQGDRLAALRQQHRAGEARVAAARATFEAGRREIAETRAAVAAAAARLATAQDDWRTALGALGELPLVDDPATAAAADLVAARINAAEVAQRRAADTLTSAQNADTAARLAQQNALARRADVDDADRALRAIADELRAIADGRAAAQTALAEHGTALAAAREALAEVLGSELDWRARLDRDRAGFAAEVHQSAVAWRSHAGDLAAACADLTALAAIAASLRLDAERRSAAAVAGARQAGLAAERAIAEATAAGAELVRALIAAGLTEADAGELLGRGPGFVDALRADLESIDRRGAHVRAVLAERQRQLAEHDAARPAAALASIDAEGELASPAGLVQARTALAAARAAVAAAERRHAEAAFRLRSDDDARAAHGAALAELAAAEADALVHRELAALIGSHDGKAFRAFAQSLSLDALLVVANHHLDELAPRYQLERVPGFDLELQVVDRDLGDEVRSVQSLSGGESFLVSLALALALSSLSARNVRVRTLLIDEGFGTLDAATLDSALAVLDALQASGRQVGVISHVPGLAERVGAQVDVRPVGGGRSVVAVRAAS
jgi:exonuclease SbcC